ncbi:MAG TPA: UxaA family hydrolase [Tissierellaceae bacterium]|nr:UxaA family hydrolase [Tissierellaceae bacterium]
MTKILGLKVNDKDNVAVVFSQEAINGAEIDVNDKIGNIDHVKLLADIPYGHKVAIKPIKEGSPILKYGEEIGTATVDIEIGDHVHIHNLDSQRSRGDKK